MIALLGITACTFNNYDTGDGYLSYLKAEMANMHTMAKGKIDYIVTDEGKQLTLSSPFTCQWADKPDTLYRAMLYYSQTKGHITAMKANYVWVISPQKPKNNFRTDPVQLTSCWLSSNRKYLNLYVGIMSGTSQIKELKQQIGLVYQGCTLQKNGKTTHRLCLLHNQNNIPQYYTYNMYISIPTSSYQRGDTVQMNINTYKGVAVKRIAL